MTRIEIESQLRLENPSTTDDAGERHYPGSDYYEATIQRWADAMEADQVPDDRKIWPDSATFLAAFTRAEQGQIALSADPDIAAMRLLLATWRGQVWSDDERVVDGLTALVDAEIISPSRRDEIVALP